MAISYIVANDAAFQAAVQTAINTVKNLTVPFNSILADFYRSEQAIFKLQGPGQYPDISEHYAAAKQRAVGFKYPLLLRSGPLAASVLQSNAPGAVVSISPTELVFGTNVSYGKYHQSDDPRSKIPLRKFLFIGPESDFANSDQVGRLQRWLGYIQDYMAASIRASGMAN